MREIPRFAVIATHNRPKELRRCVEALKPQVDMVIVIDNASDPPVDYWATLGDLNEGDWHADALPWGEDGSEDPGFTIWFRTDDEQPPNLSRLWNQGVSMAEHQMIMRGPRTKPRQWDVAVVNDDATVPAGWFDALSAAMRGAQADAVSSFQPFAEPGFGTVQRLAADAAMSVETRLTGWAFILRGEWEGARFDERFRWWCGDDDISYRARLAGGLVHVGGFRVPNEYADQSTTGVLAEQTALDMQAFVDKHGRRPW